MTPGLGLIEGYFGRPWSPQDRLHVIGTIGRLGYAFFHYAPKAEPLLRRRWREPLPDATLAGIVALSAQCRDAGLRFGVGLSPFELYRDPGGAAMADFEAKVRSLDAAGLDDLAILFDDTRGDVPDLAAREAAIVHAAMAATKATRVVMCPTYYSDDPMLDEVFGPRPDGYLEALGRRLDPRAGVYWTGEEICARQHSPGHLARVADALGRKPVLWDNYPVNDGPRMSRFLHLRAFTGRPSSIGDHLAAHAVNPALQPHLGTIPLATLPAAYREGEGYRYTRAFRDAATSLAGPGLAAMLEADLFRFEDLGLAGLGDAAPALRERYAAIDHPMAREVVAWLDGAFTTDGWE